MILGSSTVALEPITPALARRIVARDERPGDRWHAEYPFLDEIDPLRSLAASASPDPDFTMYVVRRPSDGMAVGASGSSGLPTPTGESSSGTGWFLRLEARAWRHRLSCSRSNTLVCAGQRSQRPTRKPTTSHPVASSSKAASQKCDEAAPSFSTNES